MKFFFKIYRDKYLYESDGMTFKNRIRQWLRRTPSGRYSWTENMKADILTPSEADQILESLKINRRPHIFNYGKIFLKNTEGKG